MTDRFHRYVTGTAACVIASAILIAQPASGAAQQGSAAGGGNAANQAQPEKKDNDVEETAKKAGTIATQPVRDVGISKRDIPPVLIKAIENPYTTTNMRTCRQISGGIDELNAVLGPDFAGAGDKKESKAGKLAEAGGKTVINAFIPFRGLVREISGAAPAERRYNAALDAGLARRGFLRGMAQTKGCKIS